MPVSTTPSKVDTWSPDAQVIGEVIQGVSRQLFWSVDPKMDGVIRSMHHCDLVIAFGRVFRICIPPTLPCSASQSLIELIEDHFAA